MKFIFSSLYLGKKPKINLAKISNFLIQEKGFETILWGDENSLDYLDGIPFNKKFEIKKKDVEKIPKCIWSASKFIAISQIKEPFIHVDFDVFFFRIEKILLNQNIVCLHSENTHDNLVNSLQKAMQILPKEISVFEQRSYNCGIIGGTNFNFLNKISTYLLQYLFENKYFIDKMYADHLHDNFVNINLIPVLVEQVWMFQLFKYYNENFSTYIQSDLGDENFQTEFFEKGILHFQNSAKLKSINFTAQEFIKNFNLN